MKLWTIEVHQAETGAWIGVVLRRPQKRIWFKTDLHGDMNSAFNECSNWIQARMDLEEAFAAFETERRAQKTQITATPAVA